MTGDEDGGCAGGELGIFNNGSLAWRAESTASEEEIFLFFVEAVVID